MIILRYHKRVKSQEYPAFVTYHALGKVFGIDGSSVRRLILKRFREMNNEKIMTRKQKLKMEALPLRKRYGLRFL